MQKQTLSLLSCLFFLLWIPKWSHIPSSSYMLLFCVPPRKGDLKYVVVGYQGAEGLHPVGCSLERSLDEADDRQRLAAMFR